MSAQSIFQQFNHLNIVIVGDIMIDRYLEGKVNRISPEAPVPVVHLQAEDNRLGGAANVALNVAAMGATPYLFSVIGDDANGPLLQQLAQDANINSRYLLKLPNRVTTVKTRVIAQRQHLMRVDREDVTPLLEEEAAQLLAKFRELLEQKDIHLILFQDYNKGVLTPYLIREIILEAVRRDIPTAVDPKFDNFWEYKRVTLFKPNLREIQQQLDQQVQPTMDSLQVATAEITRRLGNTFTMITLSEKGLFLQGPEGPVLIPTEAQKIADVCGAGDTVISVAALALALGVAAEPMARLANLAGGQVCEKVGVVPVDKDELEHKFTS